MSGIVKPSTNTSKEIEIPLDAEDDDIPKIIMPKHTIIEPEYYECDGKYTTFE